MQLIIVTILLLTHGNSTATDYLHRQYSETIYKPNATLVFYICCVFSTYYW